MRFTEGAKSKESMTPNIFVERDPTILKGKMTMRPTTKPGRNAKVQSKGLCGGLFGGFFGGSKKQKK